MPISKPARWVVVVASGVLAFILLSRNGLGLGQAIFAGLVSLLVAGYFAMVTRHLGRNEHRLMLKGERTLVKTRQRGVLKLVALVLGMVSVGLVVISMGLWWNVETAQVSWVPLLLAVGLAYAAVHIWQSWKYTWYVLTNLRTIKYRSLVPFLPWLGPSFDPTPFEQIVDVNDKTGFWGNIGKWGKVEIVKRLHQGSDTEQRIYYRIIHHYEEFADQLRLALQEHQHAQRLAFIEEIDAVRRTPLPRQEDDTREF